MPMSWIIVLAAVVAGWFVQLVLSYKQSTAFNHAVRELRRSGTVSVGAAGRRYRGGRAFVALAVDDHGIVRDALSLSGWTTFARARSVPALVGLKANQVSGDRDVPQLSHRLREAAREASTHYRRGASKTARAEIT
jgi:DNA-binding transcriptional regulator of glucitol operon